MTTCRTTERGGSTGASAQAADRTRIDSLPGWARTATMPPRPGVPAPRRAQPPDYELLVRVRDGLMRL
jgi:hypothetical protein